MLSKSDAEKFETPSRATGLMAAVACALIGLPALVLALFTLRAWVDHPDPLALGVALFILMFAIIALLAAYRYTQPLPAPQARKLTWPTMLVIAVFFTLLSLGGLVAIFFSRNFAVGGGVGSMVMVAFFAWRSFGEKWKARGQVGTPDTDQ